MLTEAAVTVEPPRHGRTAAKSKPETVELNAAASAGLRHVSDDTPGITRRRSGSGFSYRDARGKALRDKDTLARIRKLAIPPAWTEVWISPRADGHIQATGRDAKGRKQYRYHADWRVARDSTKYAHVMEFARGLPALRARVDEDMARPGLGRDKVLATIVHLLDTTLIRVGNEDYAQANKSYGLTTLRDRHVAVSGTELRFAFKGKSGKEWRLTLRDRRVAKVVRACQDLPGQELFQYLDEEGHRQGIDSGDVNAYLREASGHDITAKDFRTWAGTVVAAMALSAFEAVDSDTAAKRNVKAAIEHTAARLGNTPAICRKCYVHPEVLDGYMQGALLVQVQQEVEAELREDLPSLKPEEAAVLAFLHQRLDRIAKAGRH
ncbi:DNA topoisomerase IB [Roseomonas haemaphysalidis]|jgi:DNA topoisomerase-1|uniref:DNA topoisomerase n=1 Tax=Roseomonas haemaphysalidis TaxID=2768162 RepID=A0ABS3KP85_9PROT|nr:DNA topoisomerase IB [Roseomonas haemaphysalidis]MBO1079282.1 DNA topoisomerase IB [Roseomonas haemaphysalidis]